VWNLPVIPREEYRLWVVENRVLGEYLERKGSNRRLQKICKMKRFIICTNIVIVLLRQIKKMNG
jgi:hypothetical protein